MKRIASTRDYIEVHNMLYYINIWINSLFEYSTQSPAMWFSWIYVCCSAFQSISHSRRGTIPITCLPYLYTAVCTFDLQRLARITNIVRIRRTRSSITTIAPTTSYYNIITNFDFHACAMTGRPGIVLLSYQTNNYRLSPVTTCSSVILLCSRFNAK